MLIVKLVLHGSTIQEVSTFIRIDKRGGLGKRRIKAFAALPPLCST
jgi:hypothetical protein